MKERLLTALEYIPLGKKPDQEDPESFFLKKAPSLLFIEYLERARIIAQLELLSDHPGPETDAAKATTAF